MITPPARRMELLHARAEDFARVTLTNVRKEFPNDIRSVMRHPGDFPERPRQLHPAFYGCYDWHSCVEMHWLLVRLLRTTPEHVPAAEIRATLAEHLTIEALAVEAHTFRTRPPRSRPYGWGWALALIHELTTWDDPDAQTWAGNACALGEAIAARFLEWLPKATYPVRHGVHTNSAFGLSRAMPYARMRAESGEDALQEAITEAGHRWFGKDTDYPGGWEPSGADFLSPALTEAELMANLLAPDEFSAWFDRFLPGLADGRPDALFVPATVSDDSDGQIAHLHGLNLSRAWCWRRLAETLPEGDPRIAQLQDAATAHAERELDKVSGTDYMVEHWLASYAVLYLT